MTIDMDTFDPTDANQAMGAAEAYNIFHAVVQQTLLKARLVEGYALIPMADLAPLAKSVNLELA